MGGGRHLDFPENLVCNSIGSNLRAFEALMAGQLGQDVIDRDVEYGFGRQAGRAGGQGPVGQGRAGQGTR